MRAIIYRTKRLIQLGVILTMTLLIGMMIWKLFISKNRIAEDYRMLAAIAPADIISCQKDKPAAWKDYVAVLTACNNTKIEGKTNNQNMEDLKKNLLLQLNSDISFQQLDWFNANKEIMQKARKINTILNKYTIYDPEQYSFPLAQTCYYIDTYGAGREGGKRSHQGTDLFDKKGTPIFSVCRGTIEKLGWNRLGGERVGVRGDDGNYYYYAHLDSINQELSIGQRVEKGALLGAMGNTGDAISTPDHLHFGIELANAAWLNPYPFLKVWESHSF